jgi:Flp pilus assembly protein TadD
MKNRAITGLVLLVLTLVTGCAESHKKDPAELARQATAELTEGTKLLNEKKYSDAETHLRRAVQLDPNSGLAHNNLGLAYYEQGNLYDAATEFQSAARLLPTRPEPWNNLGLTLEAGDKLNEAIAEYQKAVELDPDNPEFVGNLARVHVRADKNDDETKELLRRLLEIETRPDWRLWAQRELASRSPRATEASGGESENLSKSSK